jgi:hypothetical protein
MAVVLYVAISLCDVQYYCMCCVCLHVFVFVVRACAPDVVHVASGSQV